MDEMFSRCRRKFVFGDREGGGFGGAFNFVAGVRGGSICPGTCEGWRRGDEETGGHP